jgi:hypothetical protein
MISEANIPARLPPRPRRRWGCFGCIGSSLAALLLGLLLLMAIDLVFAPWSYTLGGHFHILPYWSGWGSFKSTAAGGDYLMYVSLEPSPGSRVYPASHMTGSAWICTPARETLYMRASADMPRTFSFDTLGRPVGISMDNWGGWFPNMRMDRRPSLQFRGHWADRALVLDDQMSVSRAFAPDGTVYRGQGPHPRGGQLLNLTLKEASYWDFKAACAAMNK